MIWEEKLEAEPMEYMKLWRTKVEVKLIFYHLL
jgi:hypothetical protein